MLPTSLKAGDRVTLVPVHPGTVEVTVKEGVARICCFTATDGKVYHISGECVGEVDKFYSEHYNVVSVESSPDNWPPVRGDVWKDRVGKHYHYIGDMPPRLKPSNGRGYEDMTVEFLKKRSPVLVYREQ
jgi:hypothetical protein